MVPDPVLLGRDSLCVSQNISVRKAQATLDSSSSLCSQAMNTESGRGCRPALHCTRPTVKTALQVILGSVRARQTYRSTWPLGFMQGQFSRLATVADSCFFVPFMPSRKSYNFGHAVSWTQGSAQPGHVFPRSAGIICYSCTLSWSIGPGA